jgi:two-component system, cell cycle sensor histidine kinase and response regulator CckA
MTNATILIVEDDAILATYLQALVERLGYLAVGPVASGEEALSVVAIMSVDLVLMDIELAGAMNGIAAAETIAYSHDVPIVFLTGFSQESLIQQAKAASPYGYIIKPVAERELSAMVEMALHRHAQDRQLRESQAALRESEQMMSSIFRVAPSGIGVVRDRIMTMVNDRFCSMTGYERDEVIGRSSRMLYPTDEDFQYVGTEKYRQISEQGTGRVETRWLRKDGTLLHVILSSTPLDPLALDKGVTFTALDISERNRAEEDRQTLREQLSHAQKMEEIGRLIGGVAHDFNNHLTAIIGCSQMILSRIAEGSALGHFAEMIHSAGEKAAALTRSLLTFSRKQPLEMRPLDIRIVLGNVHKLLARLIGEDIELIVTGAEEPLYVNGDVGQIEQVLMNLVTNARDAMPDGGILRISTDRRYLDHEFMGVYGWGEPGAYGVITVQDNGVGIEPDVRERIFEPFYTSKDPGKGTGLGLSIVHGIIQQHGGHIVLESAPGTGTSFTIYLPLLEQQPQLQLNAVHLATTGGTETLLVCEDDQAVRRMVCLVLEDAGYRVFAAVDGDDALTVFRRHQDSIQLVLLDVIMPKKNGVLVFGEIRAIKPSLPAIFTSGYTPESIARSGLYDLQVPFLQKPVTPTVLLKHVRDVLDQHQGK